MLPQSHSRASAQTVLRKSSRTNVAITARQGGGPVRPVDRGRGQGRGAPGGRSSSGGRGPPPGPKKYISDAADWWKRQVFKQLPISFEPKQLPNGHAARPNYSAAGTRIEVLTNHLPLDVNVGAVTQYEVQVTRAPAATPPGGAASGDDDKDGKDSKKAKRKGLKGRGGGGARVVGGEAHAVLSYILDGAESSTRNAWVFDGSGILYTVASELGEKAAAVAATTAAAVGQASEAAAGGQGSDAAEGQEGGAAAGGGGGGDGGFLVQLPDGTSELAAGAYRVQLTRVALLDVEQCLKDAQQQQQQQQPSATEAGAEDATPSSSSSSAAAAVAVLDLVSRAAAAWVPDSVRSSAGSYVSYKQEDPNNRVSGFLPLKLLRGFRSAVSLVERGPTLTVDAASAVVAGDGPLLKQLQDALGARTAGELAAALGTKRDARRLEEALVGLEVKSSHSKMTYKLSGKFSLKSARDLTFTLQDGRTTTVEKYFKERYGVELKSPSLPCALDKKGSALPVELLTVVRSQKRMSRLDSRQKADYIRSAALAPQDRLEAARRALRDTLQGVKGEVARAFGLQPAQADFLKVPAQLLPGPLLEVARQAAVDPGNDGEWGPAGGVAVAGPWRSGAVLCYLDKAEGAGLNGLISGLDSALSRASANRPPAAMPVVWAPAPTGGGVGNPAKASQEAERWLAKAADEAKAKYGAKPDVVLVVLPSRPAAGLYEAIKDAGDRVLGIPTQCVDPKKASLVGLKAANGPAPSYCQQLALSVNAKLGGATTRPAGDPTDWAPLLKGRRLMVLGADLSRGAAAAMAGLGQQAGLAAAAEAEEEAAAAAGVEFAAVVGSVDSHVVRYSVRLIAQVAGNRDIVLGMRESVAGLLREYGANQQKLQQQRMGRMAAFAPAKGTAAAGGDGTTLPASLLPEVLLMYRDGLSDSQFDTALAVEYDAIKQACAEVGGPSYRPPVTFVVVQKSHNTRFFPASDKHKHRSGNVLPGTVVDRGVVDRAAFDFFLNAHAGIQGTNRAPRYTVLVDESGFSAESLQQLTHTLCHTYPACNRSLSHPPAVRYADRAADRARAMRHALGVRPALLAAARAGRSSTSGAPVSGAYEIIASLPHAGHVV